MNKSSITDLLGIIGGVLTVLSFVDIPFLKDTRIVFLIAGILTLGFYIRVYIEKEAISKVKGIEKKLNSLENILNRGMNRQNNKISEIRGWVTAINFFKNKKGALDPITLIIIIIIIIIIILALQGKL